MSIQVEVGKVEQNGTRFLRLYSDDVSALSPIADVLGDIKGIKSGIRKIGPVRRMLYVSLPDSTHATKVSKLLKANFKLDIPTGKTPVAPVVATKPVVKAVAAKKQVVKEEDLADDETGVLADALFTLYQALPDSEKKLFIKKAKLVLV